MNQSQQQQQEQQQDPRQVLWRFIMMYGAARTTDDQDLINFQAAQIQQILQAYQLVQLPPLPGPQAEAETTPEEEPKPENGKAKPDIVEEAPATPPSINRERERPVHRPRPHQPVRK